MFARKKAVKDILNFHKDQANVSFQAKRPPLKAAKKSKRVAFELPSIDNSANSSSSIDASLYSNLTHKPKYYNVLTVSKVFQPGNTKPTTTMKNPQETKTVSVCKNEASKTKKRDFYYDDLSHWHWKVLPPVDGRTDVTRDQPPGKFMRTYKMEREKRSISDRSLTICKSIFEVILDIYCFLAKKMFYRKIKYDLF